MGQQMRDIAEFGLPRAYIALQLRLWHIDQVGVHGTGIGERTWGKERREG